MIYKINTLLSYFLLIGLVLPIYGQAQISNSTPSPADYGSFEVIGGLFGIGTTSISAFINEDATTPMTRTINVIFKAGMAVLVAVGLILVIIGGYLYMTAGGDSNRISTAKVWIISALTGIIIGLIGWLILNTINSQLASDAHDIQLKIPCRDTEPRCAPGRTCQSSGYCELD